MERLQLVAFPQLSKIGRQAVVANAREGQADVVQRPRYLVSHPDTGCGHRDHQDRAKTNDGPQNDSVVRLELRSQLVLRRWIHGRSHEHDARRFLSRHVDAVAEKGSQKDSDSKNEHRKAQLQTEIEQVVAQLALLLLHAFRFGHEETPILVPPAT